MVWLELIAFGMMRASCWGAAADPAGIEFFEKRVRPVLVEHCYECHSASAKKLKGGLYLDTREGWARGGDSGPAIVPGDPDSSLLVRAVRWAEPDLEMPPKNKLDPAAIRALEEWVRMGAPDPRAGLASAPPAEAEALARTNHWAYQLIRRPQIPAVRDDAWPRGAVDHFVLAKMESRGLRPGPDAEPWELNRRLHFDLIGLPPSGEQQEGRADASNWSGVAREVDRLLAAPEFGEHWGRHWLDVVRFGESLTLRGFIYKEAWRYRDYVIDVFNRNRPLDQFIREQIAGDLLPHQDLEDRRRKLIATAFLAVGNWNLEEQDKKLLRMDIVDEQLDTIGKSFLAQTISCARCHDHKFDPIPTRDYYAMAGILRNTRTVTNANVSGWLEVALPVGPELEQRLHERESAIESLEAKIKAAKERAKQLAAGLDATAGGAVEPKVIAVSDLPGLVVDSARAKAVGEWKHSQHTRHYIGDGYLHDLDTGKGEKTLTFMPELKQPGRFEVRFAYAPGSNRATQVPVTVFHADGETTRTINQKDPPLVEGRFVSLGTFRFEANGFGHVLVETTGTDGHVTADAVQFLPADAAPAPRLATAAQSGPADSTQAAAAAAAAELRRLEQTLKDLRATGPQRPMTLSVCEEETIAETAVHIRGSPHNLGAPAPRGFLSVLGSAPQPALPANQSGRRELAEWITAPENPLTARVLANRIWLWLLGEGLVRTPDNFGTTGQAPSHPELLEYLAARLIESGWNTKAMVREIVLSRTYQLSSRAAAASGSEDDPGNRWLTRANRKRLTAEQLRDSILWQSGELERAQEGPSYPPELAADFGFTYSGARRSVYVPAFRNALPEIFEAFDFASPSMVVGQRDVSTVPQQALFLLNHPWVRARARAAARRLLEERPREAIEARIERVFRRALSRAPTKAETDLVRGHVGRIAGEQRDELEAWTQIAHSLFASLDFRYIH